MTTIRTRDTETQDWRAPRVPEREELVHDEPGRVLMGSALGCDVCYRSFWYRLTRSTVTRAYFLRVKHGGGEESILFAHEGDPLVKIAAALDSDGRFFLFAELMRVYNDGKERGERETARTYVNAFAQGRLKKRKARGQNVYRVHIEPEHNPLFDH